MLRKKNSTFGWTSTQRVLRYLWAHGDTLKAQTDIEVTSSPFLYSGSPVLKQSRHDQRRGGEIRWLNCSLTIRPSLKRTLRNPAKVAKRRRGLKKGMKEEGSKTPTEWEGVRGREGEGPAIEDPTGQKGAKSNLQYCTMLFCTIKWHGGQGWDNGLLSPRRRPAAPEESSFSTHMSVGASQDAPPAMAACSASGHIRSTVSLQWPVQRWGGQQGFPGNIVVIHKDSGQHSRD